MKRIRARKGLIPTDLATGYDIMVDIYFLAEI